MVSIRPSAIGRETRRRSPAKLLLKRRLPTSVGDAAERAYRRGDALEKRRAMMEAWAQWCERTSWRSLDQVASVRGMGRGAMEDSDKTAPK